MTERTNGARLPGELFELIGGDLVRAENLDSDLAAELRVACAIDLTHAAGADQPHDLVPSKTRSGLERGFDALGEVEGGRLTEASRVLVRNEHGLDFFAQCRIVGACGGEEGSTGIGMLQRLKSSVRRIQRSASYTDGLSGHVAGPRAAHLASAVMQPGSCQSPAR
jgi:hypothetical protein